MKDEKKRVLLISPTWVGLHEDIRRQLEQMGYDVSFISEYSFPEDSNRIKGKRISVAESVEESMKTQYWERNLVDCDNKFDFLIVIDGQGVNEYLFNTLKSKNPDIYCVNYLYDTTHSVYHFERNFKHFDKVFTFDRQESKKYRIDLLPIYWTPIPKADSKQRIDVFGFGSYSKERFELYKFIDGIAKDLNKTTFVKTYHNVINNKWLHLIKNCIRTVLGKHALISLSDYKSDLTTNQLLPSAEFRNLVQKSDVIIDSKVLEQDGLTARFMWALGAEKKIITTNGAAKLYPFFSENQVLILDENRPYKNQESAVRKFLSSEFKMNNECRSMIESYRIDNWINTLLSK